MAKLIEVIISEITRGNGTEDNPSRIVHQIYTKEGQLVAESDPVLNSPTFPESLYK